MSAASARVSPFGPHVGRPGSHTGSSTCSTAPEPTWAVKVAPSSSWKAIRLPSGDQAAATSAPGSEVSRRSLPEASARM